MIITEYITKKVGLNIQNESSNNQYKMFNTGGVECEVGEFLYSLVRLMKPKKVLETGTHFGISSTYIALALSHNDNDGNIITIDPIYYDEARNIHDRMELTKYITQIKLHAEVFQTNDQFDLIFLDSEPILRFQEFDTFFKNLSHGGIIIIHDLHPHLSYNSFNPDHPNYKHWPYGDFREKLGKYILNNEVQIFSFDTPRGITIFQKNKESMSYIKLLKNEL